MSYIFFIIAFPLIIYDKLFLIFSFPWKMTSHQVINKNSQSKRITFGWVESISKWFYRHIEWTSNQVLIFKNLIIFKTISKTKIAQLKSTVLDQNICRFDISMHNAILSQIPTSKTDLVWSFSPIKVLFAVDEWLKRASFTVLSDDVIVIASVIKVKKFDYIGMFYLFQNFNFIFQKFTTMLLHITYLHYLHSHNLTLIVIFITFINCTAKTTTNNVRKTVTIRTYPLLRRYHLAWLFLSWACTRVRGGISLRTGIILADGISVGYAHLSHSNKYNVKTK